jgi:hypothetical protein
MQTAKQTKRHKSTEEQWRNIHSRWVASGLTDIDFCEQENYGVEPFRYMRNKLGLPDPENPVVEPKRTKFQVRSDAAKQRWVRDDKKESFWRQQINEWKRSGKSKRAYCKFKNLSESSFNAWSREIELRDREKVSTTNAAVLLTDAEQQSPNPFVPLRLVSSGLGMAEQSEPESVSMEKPKQSLSILVPGGAVIKLDGACSASFVAELYSSLKA